MKHRSRSEIVGAILEASNEGGAENDLIEYEQGLMTYRTTENGMRLL